MLSFSAHIPDQPSIPSHSFKISEFYISPLAVKHFKKKEKARRPLAFILPPQNTFFT